MLVRPITTKPARLSRATTGASASAGGESSSAREPARVTWPLMSNRSLIATGMPAKRRGAAWALRRRSIAPAASIAACVSTWINARGPSPSLSAIFARHASTSARAVVRPDSRLAASEARPGRSDILDLHLQERRAQRLAVGVERERAGDAAAQRPCHYEIQRRDVGQLIARNLALD